MTRFYGERILVDGDEEQVFKAALLKQKLYPITFIDESLEGCCTLMMIG